MRSYLPPTLGISAQKGSNQPWQRNLTILVPVMAIDATRYIKREVERELWARAAGRCQFYGCNRPLFKSPVTQEPVNISERAHIYSFAEHGPRGWGPLITNRQQLNEIGNLMLVCHDCHKAIDQRGGERYSADQLLRWKDEHEERIAIVTGVNPSKKSHVVLYGANIGGDQSLLQPEAAKEALFPDWYPAQEHPIQLSMSWEGKDTDSEYWITEAQNLQVAFDRKIRPVLEHTEHQHLSLFGFAPIPLLIRFGTLVTDKMPAQTYQLHREPFQTWRWLAGPATLGYEIIAPQVVTNRPALVIALSDHIARSRVTAVLGEAVSIWELTVDSPHNDLLKSREQLALFRQTARKLIVQIGKVHGKDTPLAIFPAIPVGCAIDFGRIRMPKADGPWVIYDQSNHHKQFIRALEIG